MMTTKQRVVTILAVLIILLPLTGLPIAWKSGLIIVFGLLIVGVSISDWVMATWHDAEGSFTLSKSDAVAQKSSKSKSRPKTANPMPKKPSELVTSSTILESESESTEAVPVYPWPDNEGQDKSKEVNAG